MKLLSWTWGLGLLVPCALFIGIQVYLTYLTPGYLLWVRGISWAGIVVAAWVLVKAIKFEKGN